jgi:3',5'-cyclic AMP phosphodiesterase CpdA
MKILHLSDLHFRRFSDDNQEAINTLNYVKSNYPEHYIVLTGDITDDGHPHQYDNAYEALKDFIGRIFISPGNHDFGAAGLFYSLEIAERFDEYLSKPLNQEGTFLAENRPVINLVKEENDTIMIIALDTNLETNHPFDFACGEVGEFQLDALYSILSNSTIPEMKKVLFFHHHPFIVNDPFMELKDAKELVRTIYNRVDVVLFGHKHVMNKWENIWGAKYVLASDNSPGKSKAGEITIENGDISMQYVDIA